MGIGLIGLCGFITALGTSTYWQFPAATSVLFLFSGAAVPMILVSLWANRVHHRQTSGLQTQREKIDVIGSFQKYLGLLLTLGLVLAFYWALPIYHHEQYHKVWTIGRFIIGLTVVLAIFYIPWVDSYQQSKKDIYWQLGGILLGKGTGTVKRKDLREHALAWSVKGYFLPVMLKATLQNFVTWQTYGIHFQSFQEFFVSILHFIFITDATFGTIGYLFTLRALDAQIRTTERTAGGWTVTLACYPPFAALIGENYDGFKAEYDWQHWTIGWTVGYITWGTLILMCYSLYTWATICFGYRFSNLTNRGIIDFGPYRWTKHPAYLFKCLAWWASMVPIVAFTSLWTCVQATILLSIQCFIYWLRARTEERHLGKDPAYQLYSRWIEQYGWHAKIKRFISPSIVFDSTDLRNKK